MNGFLNWMEEHFMPVAAKVGNQKHLVAIRDAFIAIMPITMVGSIAVLLNVFFRDLPNSWWGDGNSFVAAMTPLINVNGNVYFGSIVILSLAFSFALGYQIAKTYNVNPIAGGVIAFSAVVVCMNQSAVFDFTLANVDVASVSALNDLGVEAVASGDAVNIAVSGWGYMGSAYTGASGLFTALIVGLLSSMIYVQLMIHKITIKMPDNVPPAVGNAFAAIIPGCVAIYIFAIVTQICVAGAGMYPNELIQKWIQAPLMGLSQNMFSAILVSFLVQLLWFFGLPIVLNPIYLIPWLIVPPVCTLIAYLFTAGGIIPPVYVQVPWVMPVGIYAFLATGGSLMAGVVALINLAVSFAIWTPFVLLANRTQEVE